MTDKNRGFINDGDRDSTSVIFDPVTEERTEYVTDGTSIASVLVYAAGAANVYNEIASSLNGLSQVTDSLSPTAEIFCKPTVSDQDNNQQDESFGDIVETCFDQKGGIYKEVVETATEVSELNVGQNILNFLSLLNKAAQPTNVVECINPYFSKFFYLIPYQLIIKDLLSKALEGLPDKDKDTVFKKLGDKCGPELKIVYETTNPLELRNLEPLTLPPLPYVRIPKLSDIIRKFVMDAYCLSACIALTPRMNQLSKRLIDTLSRIDAIGPDGNTTIEIQEYEKRNLNEYVFIQALSAALKEGLIQKLGTSYDKSVESAEKQDELLIDADPDKDEVAGNIQKFFKDLYEDPSEAVEGGKMAFLLFGQATCETLDYIALKKIDPDVNLSNIFGFAGLEKPQKQKKVLDFFRFIGQFANKISLINDSIPPECPIDPCSIEDIDIQDLSQFCAPEPDINIPDFSGLFGLDGASAAVFRLLVQPVYDKYQVVRGDYKFGDYEQKGLKQQIDNMNQYVKNIFNVPDGLNTSADYSVLLFGPKNDSDDGTKNSKLLEEYETLKEKKIFESGFDMSETNKIIEKSSSFLDPEQRSKLASFSEAWLTKAVKLENGVL